MLLSSKRFVLKKILIYFLFFVFFFLALDFRISSIYLKLRSPSYYLILLIIRVLQILFSNLIVSCSVIAYCQSFLSITIIDSIIILRIFLKNMYIISYDQKLNKKNLELVP